MGTRIERDRLYIYPTGLKVEEVLSAAARQAGCLLDYRVVTFPELTDMLFREAGSCQPLLPEALARAVAGSVIARRGAARRCLAPAAPPRGGGALGCLAWAAPAVGVAQGCLRIIREFQEAYMTPDDIETLACQVGKEEVRERLRMLNIIYREYHDTLGRLGWVDRHGRQWRALSFLREALGQGSRPRCLAGIRKVVLAEMYDFSVTQFLLATTLILLIGDAELVIQSEAVDVDAMAFCQRTWNRFVEDRTIADLVLPEFVNREGRQGNLGALLGGLFRPARGPAQRADGSVELLVAQSRYYECEEVGRHVRRLLESGLPPDRIAVLARSLGVYGDLIEDVFCRYRIPVYFRKGRPLASIGVVKHLVNLLRSIAESFPRQRLESVLTSPYLASALESPADVLARLEYLDEERTPLAQCRRALELALSRAQESSGEHTLLDRASLGALLSRLAAIEEMVGRLRGLDRPRLCAEHVSALLALFGDLGLRMGEEGEEGWEWVRRDHLAWARSRDLLQALAQAGEGIAPGPLEFSRFTRLVLDAIEGEQLDEPVLAQGGVRVLTVEDARGLEFDTVFLLGLDDGTFPAAAGDDPLLPDRLRVEMNREAANLLRRKLGHAAAGLPLGAVFPTSSEERRRDPLLFYLAVSMAQRKLVFSYPVANEKGNPTVCSPFLDEVAALVDLGSHADPARVAGQVVPRLEDCFEIAEVANRLAWDGWAGAAVLEASLGSARLADIRRRAAVEENRAAFFRSRGQQGRPRSSLVPDRYLGRIGPLGGTLRQLMTGKRWDAAAVDDLGACRFKFFAAHVLGIGVEEEAGAQVSWRRQGEIVHLLLRDTFQRYPELPASWPRDRSEIVAYLARARERFLSAIPSPSRALWELAWEGLEESVVELLASEFAQSEGRPGEKKPVERLLEWPCQLSIEDHRPLPAQSRLRLALRGRIDRVDITRDASGSSVELIRVIDYKLSRGGDYQSRLDPGKSMGTTSFQIPIYVMALVADPGALPGVDAGTRVEACYYLLRAERKILAREVDRSIFVVDPAARALAAEPLPIASRLTQLFSHAAEGEFDVDPVECDDFCPYRPLCRYRRPGAGLLVDAP